MRFAIALALVFSIGAEGQTYRRSPWPQPAVRRGWPRRDAAALRVLPAGGGQSGLVPLCDALTSAEKVGSWTCLYGDGTTASGGQAFSNLGSPATQTMAVCPNGPNCAPVTRQVHAANTGATTASFASGTGAFTACWLGTVDDSAAGPLMTQSTSGTAATISWYLEWGGTNFDGIVSDGAASSNPAIAGTGVRGDNFVCLSHPGGNAVASLYVNGSAPTNGVSKARQSLVAAVTVNGTNGVAASGHSLRTRGAFVTFTQLSDVRITQLASAVLGSLSGSGGEALTFARASAAGCEDETGSVVMDLPNNRPCVTRAGLAVRPAWTELLLRTSEIDNAAWTKDGNVTAPTVTANTTDVAAPDGTFTAEKIVFPSVAAPNYSRAWQSYTATVAPYSEGVWLRTLSGTCSQYLSTYVTLPALSASTLCTANTTWTRCKVENITKSVATWLTVLGNDRSAGSPLSDTTGCTLYAWRANSAQIAALPLGGVDASSATVSVAVESASVPVASATLYSQSGRYFAPTVLGTSKRGLGDWRIDANNVTDHLVATNGTLQCFWVTGGVSKSLSSVATVALGAWNKLRCAWDGATMTACVNDTCLSSAVAGTVPSGASTFYPGTAPATGNEAAGLVADDCLGNSPGACP